MSQKVLLVDDNSLGLIARKTVLEEIGYSVTACKSAAEALEQFGKETFELVITDYKMPKMDGIELIGQIRTVSPVIPIILLSGFTESLGLTEKSTGADVVLQKSANEVTHLTRAVHRLLNKKSVKKPVTSQRSTVAKAKKKTI